MRDFRHENFVQFVGATIDPPHICIVSNFFPRTLKVTDDEQLKADSFTVISYEKIVVAGNDGKVTHDPLHLSIFS